MRALAVAGIAGLSGFIAGTGPVLGEPVALPGSDYGRIDLPLRQSLGSAVEAVVTQGNVFEPIKYLRDDDPLARAARSVARLDVLIPGKPEQLATCTATLISARHAISNHHCIARGVAKASIVIDYLEQSDRGATRLSLATEPVEANAVLDYAILELRDPVPAGIEPIRLAAREVPPRHRLRIVHHPAGRPKVMTQFRCSAAASTVAGQPLVRHTCDTLPGSSGALLLDHDNFGVALHHTGGLMKNDPDSFNSATSVAALARESPIIADLIAASASASNAVGAWRPSLAAPVQDDESLPAARRIDEHINDLIGR